MLKEHVWNELAPRFSEGALTGLREVRIRGEGRGVAGRGAASRCRPAAARGVVLRR